MKTNSDFPYIMHYWHPSRLHHFTFTSAPKNSHICSLIDEQKKGLTILSKHVEFIFIVDNTPSIVYRRPKQACRRKKKRERKNWVEIA